MNASTIEKRTGYRVDAGRNLVAAPCCCFGDDHHGHPYCDEPTEELLRAEQDGLITRVFDGTWRWVMTAR